MNPQNDEVEIDLKELFQVIMKNIVIVIAVAVLAGGITGVVNRFLIKPTYTSTVKMFTAAKSSTFSIADFQLGSSVTKDYIALLTSRPMVEKLIARQGLKDTYAQMRDKITIEVPSGTRFLYITVEYDEPNTAKAVVDDFATIAAEEIVNIMGMEMPVVVEQGYVAKSPIRPRTTRNALIAAVLAAFLAVGGIVLLYVMNDRIRSVEDVERYLELSVLSVIPEAGSEYKSKKKKKKKEIMVQI